MKNRSYQITSVCSCSRSAEKDTEKVEAKDDRELKSAEACGKKQWFGGTGCGCVLYTLRDEHGMNLWSLLLGQIF